MLFLARKTHRMKLKIYVVDVEINDILAFFAIKKFVQNVQICYLTNQNILKSYFFVFVNWLFLRVFEI